MSEAMKLGIICGVLIGVILVVILVRWMKTDGSRKCRYDERQELVRGRGFKYAFFTLMIYNGIYLILNLLFDKMPADPASGIFIGICISVSVYAIYGIWHDGYLALNENPVRVIVAFICIGLFNVVVTIHSFMEGDIIVDGQLTFHSTNLFCAVLLLLIAATILVKRIKTQKEE
ncbi:MAG: hypothetical protein MR308_07505 [Lachnospiraceae bacterium]|nr:hypothetical protein [Lachnospiraceae bacterium]